MLQGRDFRAGQPSEVTGADDLGQFRDLLVTHPAAPAGER
jgi:hypothetical protein